jgi:sugar phosphate permease
MLFGIISTGLGILVISFSKNSLINPMVTYYAGFLIMGLGSSLATSMLPSAVIARWFHRDIGKANGVFYLGAGIGGVMVPLVVKLVDSYGWQNTLLYSGIGFIITGIPLSFVLRRKPEDFGLLPDGKVENNTNASNKIRRNNNFGVPIKKALKMRAFWYLNVVILFQTAVLGIITQFAIPYLTNMGISREAAGFVVLLFTIVSLVGRFSLGILIDIFNKKYVQALTIVLLGLGVFLFWMMDARTPFWLTILFAITYGIGIAGIMPLRLPLMVEYFGTRNIGAIFGITSISGMIAGVVGAPLVGRVFDVYHDYKPALIFLVAFSLIALVLMLAMPAPPKNGQVTAMSAASTGEAESGG